MIQIQEEEEKNIDEYNETKLDNSDYTKLDNSDYTKLDNRDDTKLDNRDDTKLDNIHDSFNKKMSYNNLEKLRKTIELLSKEHHIEIAKILKNNKIKLNENNNGIFINLNNVDNLIINQIQTYINFIKNQEMHITIDESKKENLENIYFNKE